MESLSWVSVTLRATHQRPEKVKKKRKRGRTTDKEKGISGWLFLNASPETDPKSTNGALSHHSIQLLATRCSTLTLISFYTLFSLSSSLCLHLCLPLFLFLCVSFFAHPIYKRPSFLLLLLFLFFYFFTHAKYFIASLYTSVLCKKNDVVPPVHFARFGTSSVAAIYTKSLAVVSLCGQMSTVDTRYRSSNTLHRGGIDCITSLYSAS